MKVEGVSGTTCVTSASFAALFNTAYGHTENELQATTGGQEGETAQFTFLSQPSMA
jgi:hypothetical protein